jgi:hypothetical protein
VLKLEADGSPCASGTGGTAGNGGFEASWDTETNGCYRVDAHSAGAECGFGANISITIDWCAGRTNTLQYEQNAGWTPLGIFPFYHGHLGGITQGSGAVDAFRVVKQPDCQMRVPIFGSLTVDTDAEEMPVDLASQLAAMPEVAEMGKVLTASFRPYVEPTRRLSATQQNHVVIDFDTRETGQLSMPTEAAISEAAQKACTLLATTTCATHVTFKFDSRPEVKTVNPNPPQEEPAPQEVSPPEVSPQEVPAPKEEPAPIASAPKEGDRDGSSDVKTPKKEEEELERNVDQTTQVVMVMPLALTFLCFGAVFAKKHAKGQSESKDTAQEQNEAAEEGTPVVDADEKKPQQYDDNASTATPVSLGDSVASLEQNVADQVV